MFALNVHRSNEWENESLPISPWVIQMRFSTADSAGPVPGIRHTILPFNHPTRPPGRIVRICVCVCLCWKKMCVCVGGDWRGLSIGHLIPKTTSRSEPQWEGRQRCRIFLNEITPYTPSPTTPTSRILSAGPLIGRAYRSLTSDSSSCGWVRAQEQPFCLP